MFGLVIDDLLVPSDVIRNVGGHPLVLDGVAGHALVHTLRPVDVLACPCIESTVIRASLGRLWRLRSLHRVVSDCLCLSGDLDCLAVV